MVRKARRTGGGIVVAVRIKSFWAGHVAVQSASASPLALTSDHHFVSVGTPDNNAVSVMDVML